MKNQNYMLWAILLLAGAVILPTVCLLWFMGQALQNTQLAMRQKMLDFYQYQLRVIGKEQLETAIDQQIIPIFKKDNKNQALLGSICDSLLVYDANGLILEPDLRDVATPSQLGLLAEAEKLENQNDPNAAIAAYQAITQKTDANSVRIGAAIGNARCLLKLKKSNQALALLRDISHTRYSENDPAMRMQQCYAAMFLLDIVPVADEQFKDDLLNLLTLTGFKMPSSTHVMALNKFVTAAADIKQDALILTCVKKARILIRSENIAIMLLQNESGDDITKGHIKRTFFDAGQDFYGIFDEDDSQKNKFALIFSKNHICEMLQAYLDQMYCLQAQCQIYDDKGRLLIDQAGQNTAPFLTLPLNETFFPKWSVKLYLMDQTLFEKNVSRQRIMYIWGGVLVIACMFAISGLGLNMLIRQAKLNRLKNDFLATVSHELRTPLASMRLMLDTLLEGRYSDEHKAREYLELAAKENARLTRLIENFLSFSKMARNKKSFDIQPASAQEMANGAEAALKSKYQQHNCDFEMTVAPNLPEVMADKDAMITVLVNLLDNACKYTGADDKQIRLNVFYNNGQVYFQVADNGIGMSRRATRKIFDKFYQVDQSLSRKAEGCGLGLSIVKFIVDAHKGNIDVESKVGKGTTFTVRLDAIV